jgi:hypothetical protein
MKMSQYVKLADGTWAQRVQIAGTDDSGSGALGVELKGSIVAQPVDVQARYQTTIQTHAGVMIAPSALNQSAWVDVSSFDKLAVNVTNDAFKNFSLVLLWSTNGTDVSGRESLPVAAAQRWVSHEVGTKLKYVKVELQNTDVEPHTFSSHVYLKA